MELDSRHTHRRSSGDWCSGDAGRHALSVSVADTHATGASVCRQPEPSLRAPFHQPLPPRASRQIHTVLVASIASVVSPTSHGAPVNDRCTRYVCLGRRIHRPLRAAALRNLSTSCFQEILPELMISCLHFHRAHRAVVFLPSWFRNNATVTGGQEIRRNSFRKNSP